MTLVVVHVEPAPQRRHHADHFLPVDFERSSHAQDLPFLEAGKAVHAGGPHPVGPAAEDAGGVWRSEVLGSVCHEVGASGGVPGEAIEWVNLEGGVDYNWHATFVGDGYGVLDLDEIPGLLNCGVQQGCSAGTDGVGQFVGRGA